MENVAGIEEIAVWLEENGFRLEENVVRLEENAVLLEENAFQLKENAARLEENAFRLEETVARLEENAFQLKEIAVQQEENGFQLEENTVRSTEYARSEERGERSIHLLADTSRPFAAGTDGRFPTQPHGWPMLTGNSSFISFIGNADLVRASGVRRSPLFTERRMTQRLNHPPSQLSTLIPYHHP